MYDQLFNCFIIVKWFQELLSDIKTLIDIYYLFADT